MGVCVQEMGDKVLVFSQSLLTLDMIEHLLQVRHNPRCPCRATAAPRRVQVRNKANIVGLGCRLCTRASGSKAGTTTASMAQPTRRLARHAYSAFSPNRVSPCLVHSLAAVAAAYLPYGTTLRRKRAGHFCWQYFCWLGTHTRQQS
jgi:hypothetical protein